MTVRRSAGWVALGLAAAFTANAEASLPDVSEALHECRIAGLSHSVQCGRLRRPLDPARPDGPAIGVAYVVVPALARQKLADPVFFLAGGPGQSAIDVAPQVMPMFSRLNNRRDIVFVDQRGTGRSEPLDCPKPPGKAALDASNVDEEVASLLRCKAALVTRPRLREPGALGFFTTPIAMQDLDAVRRALGAARIDLVGISYGTRAALDYLRQFPGAVRRAVLDAVAPPDMVLPASFSTDGQAALEALVGSCEREAGCRSAFPHLRAYWAALLAGLPRTVRVPDPLTGVPKSMALSRAAVMSAVRGALYSPVAASALPAAIAAAAEGRYEPLLGVGSLLEAGRTSSLAFGMHFSVVCAEDVPLLAKSAEPANLPGVDFGAGSTALYRRVCADWPRGDVPAAFYTTPPTPVPTLLLSGGLDPATPPRHAQRVARALGPRALLVTVPNAGHGVLAAGCGPDVLYRFVDAADDRAASSTETDCLTRIPRPFAYLPIR